MGISFDIQNPVCERLPDEYGKESYEVRIYYRGPWLYRGSPPSLRINLNRDEIIAFPVKYKKIFHLYSDTGDLPSSKLLVYSLEEILVEKLRAFIAQRRFVISRDLFDIYFVIENGAHIDKSLQAFREKCRNKNILLDKIDYEKVLDSKRDFELDWERNVEYLVPQYYKVSFDTAWNRITKIVQKMAESDLAN